MTRPPMIGLTGYASSGKSTVASLLQAGQGYTRLRFAGPLKKMMRGLGLSEEEIEGTLKEQPCARLNGRTPRQGMQWLGTEWGRHFFGDDFWVNLAMDDAARIDDGGGHVVFEDCRFENEAQAIRDRGGYILRIERTGFGPVNKHASDNYYIKPDATIYNSKDVSFLADAVDLALDVLPKR